jgi:hypothetical protein
VTECLQGSAVPLGWQAVIPNPDAAADGRPAVIPINPGHNVQQWIVDSDYRNMKLARCFYLRHHTHPCLKSGLIQPTTVTLHIVRVFTYATRGTIYEANYDETKPQCTSLRSMMTRISPRLRRPALCEFLGSVLREASIGIPLS